MKVAFVHDWFTMPGGAEKVATEIIDLIQPHAVFSLFNFMDDESLRHITQNRSIQTSFLQKIPFASKHYRHLAPLYPRAISKLDLSGFDVIISSSWMAAKGVQKHPSQIHICYCHTPMRFAWGLESTYLEKYGYDKGLKRVFARFLIKRLKKWDSKTAPTVDYFISNSEFVKQRIRYAYGRRANVIYPPVNTEKFALHTNKSDYYFTASRFVDYKNIDLIVSAFNRLPGKRLLVAGKGPLEKQLKKLALPNIEFLGWLTDEQLVYYMQRSKAFINASIEDFGIAGLEAQSTGTPVIALGIGGYFETVIEDETGIFFHREHPEALADAIIRFERTEFDAHRIRENALRFDNTVFREAFLNFFLDKTFSLEHEMA
ncbi:glycosyltransferase [Salibacteraceae bacterium]|jgi:glycosyltransferase involved in cell wall biosynthesis|nr:glycosyltransferase [Salibacteraceae bacterium]